MDKYILSYGGGVNSSALFFYIIEKHLPLDEVLFSDTGAEFDETYRSVEEMQEICKEKDIEFHWLKNEKLGNIYDYYWNKKAVPYIRRRDCTGKFKVSVIRNYLRNKYGKNCKFNMYIGISWDEATRCKDSDVSYITNIYPFVDDKIDRQGNININEKNNFKCFKSGCWFCPFTKKTEWERLRKEYPELFKKAQALEENAKTTLNPNYSLKKFNNKTLTEFEDIEITCDNINGGCFL